MASRFHLVLIAIAISAGGCSSTRPITYNLNGVDKVESADSMYDITRSVGLHIEPFEDLRQVVPENGILFVRNRETRLYDKDYCINAEEHYKKNTVSNQVARLMAGHLRRRGTFKSVSSASSEPAEYSLTGKLKRLYGEQESSTTAKVGSFFGLVGMLATSGATTNGTIAIEFTDLVVHRNSDGTEIKLDDVNDSFAGELHADADCWCIYDNVNKQIKSSMEKLVELVEGAVADLESSKP